MGISATLKANASAVALGTITGIQPSVLETPDGRYVVRYEGVSADDAADGLNAWLDTVANRADTGPKPDVVYDMGGVVTRVVLRQALPWLLGACITGYLAGWYLGHDRDKR
jgi:hypothetical protein